MGQFEVQEANKCKTSPEGMVNTQAEAPKTYKVNPREILIQVLHRPQEAIHSGLIDSSYTWVDHGCGFQRIQDQFNGWIHVSRNWQTRLFMERKEFKFLLILDADEGVPWYVPYALAEWDLPIVSGMVCGFTAERGIFACVAVKGPDGKARFPNVRGTKTVPLKGIQEVHNAGTGALMVRRDVLEAMWGRYDKDKSFGQPFGIPQKEQEQAALQGAMPRGEDICFTDRARALGFKSYVDWSCKIQHFKNFNLEWPADCIVDIDPKRWAKMVWPKK